MLELVEAMTLAFVAGKRPPLLIKVLLSVMFLLAVSGIVCGLLAKL